MLYLGNINWQVKDTASKTMMLMDSEFLKLLDKTCKSYLTASKLLLEK